MVPIVPSSTGLSEPQRREALRLYDRALDLQEKGTPGNTRRAYLGDWRRFEVWCQALGQRALPASPQTVILYLTHLADPDRSASNNARAGACSPSTIDRALSSISYIHRSRGFVSPRESVHVREHLRKIKVARKRPKRQAAPLLVEHLQAIVALMPATEPRVVRDKALLLIGWSGALRRSELAALDREDLCFRPEGIVLSIRSSKTDQTAEGAELAIAAATHHPELCPVAAARAWLAIHESVGPLFVRRWFRELHTDRIPSFEINDVVQYWSRRAGLSPENAALGFSAHSLRAGFITSAIRAGVPEWQIMAHTRHESYDVFRSYIRGANLFQDNPGKGLL